MVVSSCTSHPGIRAGTPKSVPPSPEASVFPYLTVARRELGNWGNPYYPFKAGAKGRLVSQVYMVDGEEEPPLVETSSAWLVLKILVTPIAMQTGVKDFDPNTIRQLLTLSHGTSSSLVEQVGMVVRKGLTRNNLILRYLKWMVLAPTTLIDFGWS